MYIHIIYTYHTGRTVLDTGLSCFSVHHHVDDTHIYVHIFVCIYTYIYMYTHILYTYHIGRTVLDTGLSCFSVHHHVGDTHIYMYTFDMAYIHIYIRIYM